MRTVLIIPTYNERDTIVTLINDIRAVCTADIFTIDDNSPDGTGRILDEQQKRTTGLYVIHRDAKHGLGSAYREGFARALAHGYDRIIQMDGDGSHRPEYLDGMLRESEGHDVVIGSRYVPGGGITEWSFHRKILSLGANHYTNIILGLRTKRYRVRDSTSGFKCWRADFLRRLPLQNIRSDGYAFQIEMNWLAVMHNARVSELPIVFHDRKLGRSKVSQSNILKTALLPWQLALSLKKTHALQ